MFYVTPFAGVWIEIQSKAAYAIQCLSLPSRECGLKLEIRDDYENLKNVTPFAGVWIEIRLSFCRHFVHGSLPSRECGLKCTCRLVTLLVCRVTPFAGVWIEISMNGRKYITKSVTPFAGVWIEIASSFLEVFPSNCHSLRGSVD